MNIDELGYVEEMRKRLGLEEDDTTLDPRIEQMTPLKRVGLIAGWYLGDASWASTFKEWCESQNMILLDAGELKEIEVFIRTKDNGSVNTEIYNKMLNVFKEIL